MYLGCISGLGFTLLLPFFLSCLLQEMYAFVHSNGIWSISRKHGYFIVSPKSLCV